MGEERGKIQVDWALESTNTVNQVTFIFHSTGKSGKVKATWCICCRMLGSSVFAN